MKSPTKQMLDELARKGFEYESVDYIFQNVRSLPQPAVESVLKWLPLVYKEKLIRGDHLVRSLIGVEQPFDPATIIDLFENSSYSKAIKDGMALVLAKAKTFDISDWIRNQLLNKEAKFESDSLIDGLETKAGFKSSEELIEFLKKIFSKYIFFENIQKLFQRHATKEDIPFLEKYLDGTSNKKEQADIARMIKHIQNKKNMPKFPLADADIKSKKSKPLFTTQIKRQENKN